MERIRGFSSLFLRLALGLSFLSAVADRFGLWGAFGQPSVSWGNFARFVAYTGKLNWFLPEALIPALAITATCAEALLGLCLVIGWLTRSARPNERNSPDLVRGLDDSGFGSERASELFRLFGRRRSIPFGNLYRVSVWRGLAPSPALNCRSLP